MFIPPVLATGNVTTNLSTTDFGNWMGASALNSVSFDSINNGAYLALASGKFGYYDKAANVTHNLTGTDANNWMGANAINGVSFDSINNGAYLGLASGLGFYNKSANVTHDLSTTDVGNWIGSTPINGLAFDNITNGVYLALASGKFGYYDMVANVTRNLSTTDAGNWIGTTIIYKVSFDSINNGAYLALDSGKFGYYDRAANVTRNLSATDAGNWIGASTLRSVSFDSINNGAYFGTNNGRLGFYNKSANVTHDLSTTDVGNWMSLTGIFGLAFDNIANGVYLALASGKFGYYDMVANVTRNLSATDVGNWMGANAINGVSFDSINNGAYLGLASGSFGYYLSSDLQKPSFYQNSTNTSSPLINQRIKLNINWTDNIALSKNYFETNITGTIKNYTTSLSGKTQKVNITNKSSGLTGRFYWKSYTNDSSGNWNYTSQMFFNVSSTTTTVAPTTGGGGGGSKSIFDFSIYPDAFKVLLKPGQTLYRNLIIKNTGNRLLTDIGILPDMQDFIGLSDNKFSLKPGQEKIVTVSFSSSTDKQPGIYNGVISVETSGIIKKILSIIEVIELKPLFDIKVELAQAYQSISPGQTVDANIILYNFGDLKPVDVQLFYSLRDIEGNDIASKEEAIAVTEQKQITRSLSIPVDAKPGNYLFYSKIIYGENAQASGSSLFKISAIQLQQGQDYTTLIILGIASLLLILAIIVLIRLIARYRKSLNYKSYYPMLRSEILSRLQQGYSKEQILESAKLAGWPESIVKSALLSL